MPVAARQQCPESVRMTRAGPACGQSLVSKPQWLLAQEALHGGHCTPYSVLEQSMMILQANDFASPGQMCENLVWQQLRVQGCRSRLTWTN